MQGRGDITAFWIGRQLPDLGLPLHPRTFVSQTSKEDVRHAS